MRNNSFVLITGASRGIGRALAYQFAANFHDLVLVARDLEALEAFAIELTGAYGVKVHACGADLASDGGTDAVVDFCRARELDIGTVVNNAGVLSAGEMGDTATKDLRNLVNLNIRAAAELSLAFLPEMRARKAGNIINISSLGSLSPLGSAGLYSASKAFLTHFTDALRQELAGTGIECHTVMLGPIKTDMLANSDGRVGWLHALASSPDGVAQVIYDGFLANRRKFSAGVLGSTLMFVSSLLPQSVVAPLVQRLT